MILLEILMLVENVPGHLGALISTNEIHFVRLAAGLTSYFTLMDLRKVKIKLWKRVTMPDAFEEYL